METNSNWKRDLLLIPLVVGIVVAAVTYVLPKYFEKGKKLSYSIDGPTAYVNSGAIGAVKITIGGIETTNVFGYKVRLWNSGSVSLTGLAVRFAFETVDTNFTIFNVTHDTLPKKEFGKIEENGSDACSKRFVYELLNPKDQDVLTFVTDRNAPLSVFAKSEGLRTELVEASNQPSKFESWLKVTNIVMAVSVSLVTLWYSLLITRNERRAREAELKRVLESRNELQKELMQHSKK
jgi:hypothetical protein